MGHKTIAFLLGILVVAVSSCKQPDLTPAYIQINYEDINNCVDVSTFNADHELNYDDEQLSAFQQHNFTHVNVYVNGNNLGCWKVPCKVPVLDMNGTDSAKLILLPAFNHSGMARTVQGYPFFNVLRQTVLLKPGETYKVSDNPPTYKYSSYAKIPFLETFSNSSSFSPNDTTTNRLTFIPVVEDGRTAGMLTLNDANGLSFDVISTDITIPATNYYVYLEMTYKTEASIDVGFKLSTATYSNKVEQVGGVYATDGDWKTVYMYLGNVISNNHNYSYTNAIGQIVLTGVGDNGKDTRFFIDNIKVIYEPSV